MPKYLVYPLSVLVLLLLLWFLYGYFSKTNAQMKIGGNTFQIEVVSNFSSQARGLSGRKSLAENSGMLFVYDKPATRHFWMNRMNFSLDFVWVRDFKVVGVSENIPHPAANNDKIYRIKSPEAADMILEIDAGVVESAGIKVGDSVEILR